MECSEVLISGDVQTVLSGNLLERSGSCSATHFLQAGGGGALKAILRMLSVAAFRS